MGSSEGNFKAPQAISEAEAKEKALKFAGSEEVAGR
jgi:hypothetical protein